MAWRRGCSITSVIRRNRSHELSRPASPAPASHRCPPAPRARDPAEPRQLHPAAVRLQRGGGAAPDRGDARLRPDERGRDCRRSAASSGALGVPGVILFGIPDAKDSEGAAASDPHGPVATRAQRRSGASIRRCRCGRTSASASTPTMATAGRSPPARTGAWTWTTTRPCRCWPGRRSPTREAGADVVAPSDMMDGRVGGHSPRPRRGGADRRRHRLLRREVRLRHSTDRSARRPDSTPAFGDRRGYQMDPANGREALREVALDLDEGADIVMVKPALAYLDVICQVKERFGVPVAAYNVSGEYAMIRAAARAGWLDEPRDDPGDARLHPARRRRHHPDLLRQGGREAARLAARGSTMTVPITASPRGGASQDAVRSRPPPDSGRSQLARARVSGASAVRRSSSPGPRGPRLGRGRRRVHRLHRLVGADDSRPRPSGRGGGGSPAGRTRHLLRRADAARGGDGRAHRGTSCLRSRWCGW